MEKEALIEEFALQREPLLQACWAHQLWNKKKLTTQDGKPIEVLFPGWLNKGPGPDFREAKLLIGPDEFFGDVEIHLDPTDWKNHGHHQDPQYERVILHVVLKNEREPVSTVSGRLLTTMVVVDFLSEQLLEVMHDPSDMLSRYEHLPGRCGVKAAFKGQKNIENILAQAAEERARQKSERMQNLQNSSNHEQILFEQIAYYLGFRANAETFRDIAIRFPIKEISPYLDLKIMDARQQILALWFGASGVLDDVENNEIDENAKEDHSTLKTIWEKKNERPIKRSLTHSGARPWSFPERRLVGLFYHLWGHGSNGLLKGWLGLLLELDKIRDDSNFKKKSLQLLEKAFDAPPNEEWNHRFSFNTSKQEKKARLIGEEKIISIIANAVVPFFLALARQNGDKELEKLLYRLFIVLPSEGKNSIVRFMEKRLAFSKPVPNTLRFHQGLIQIHKDFCLRFDQGCQNCEFVDRI